jgi:hypothetical protein
LIKQFIFKNFELICWSAGLLSLALSDPSAETHFSLCPLKMMGISWCPGCGLGHAVGWLLHGNIQNALHAHWLGIPALIILSYRIFVLSGHMSRTRVFSGTK